MAPQAEMGLGAWWQVGGRLTVDNTNTPLKKTYRFCLKCFRLAIVPVLDQPSAIPASRLGKSNGLGIRFFAQKRPSKEQAPECVCDECEFGWVQYVEEVAGWEYDNDVGGALHRILPENPWTEGVPDPPGSKVGVGMPWAVDGAPKLDYTYYPNIPSKDSKGRPDYKYLRFITKFVCKKKDGTYTVIQQFYWNYYRSTIKLKCMFSLYSNRKNANNNCP